MRASVLLFVAGVAACSDANPSTSNDASSDPTAVPADTSTPIDASSDVSSEAADAAPSCPYLFCEDFESGKLGPAWTTDVSAPNTVEVTMSKAAHGAFSLHAHVGNQGQQALITEKASQKGATLSHVFGREYMFVVAPPPSHTAWILGISEPIDTATERLEIGNYMGSWQLTPWSSKKGEFPIASGKVPTAWACVQWELDNTTGHIAVSGPTVMGADFPGNAQTKAWIPNGIAQLDFGILYVGSGATVDAYVDDIAIDDKTVPCTP